MNHVEYVALFYTFPLVKSASIVQHPKIPLNLNIIVFYLKSSVLKESQNNE